MIREFPASVVLRYAQLPELADRGVHDSGFEPTSETGPDANEDRDS